MSSIVAITRFFTVAILIAGMVLPTVAEAVIVEPGFESEVVAGGFILPTAMAFAPDGRIFVAEKGGAVRVIKNGSLLATPLITLTDINTFGDRGLLGMAVDPNFASNGYLYLSYTFENTPGANVGGEKTGRIVRVTVVGDVALESSKVIIVGTVTGTSASPSCDDFAITDDCIPSDSPSHSVGGLRFGPDGKLYATLGDGAHFDYADPRSLRSQNLDSLAGKLLRINTDGTAPADNPFYNGNPNANRSKVYALGLRNAFRLNFNELTGRLYLGDVGWSNFEEVNYVTPGANFGWPCIEGTTNTSHNCAPSSTPADPLYFYPHNASGAGSVTVGAFGANNAYPDQYDTSLFLGDYAQNWIKRVVLDAAGAVVSVEMFDDSPDGPVDLSTGIDGNIYYLSIYTGELHRITHTTGNRRPVVEITATPSAGVLPLEVAFSSTGTYDPDGDSVTYAWNFGDGTVSTLANPTHTYTTAGTYNAALTVTDSNGSEASKSVAITAGNQAPVASITSPASGSLYLVNQTINLSGEGIDLEDGTLPASAFHWTIILHHNTHIHIEQEFFNTKTPSFVAPDHNASDVYVEVKLEVMDANGLVGTSNINMYLNNGSSAGNLVANPSLEIANETTGKPLSWHEGWFGVMNPIFTYPVAGFEGLSAAMLEITGYVSGDAKWYFDPVFVSPGAQYTFKNKYTATVETTIAVQFALTNGSYQYLQLGAVPPVATPTALQYTFTIPENVQSATVFHQMGQNGVLIVDDYYLALASDTENPSVSVTSPADGATVSGMLTVDVAAADNLGVAAVQLVVDGVDVQVEDTEAPFSFTLDTTTLSAGAHTIAARARDAAGNTATAATVNVTVNNVVNLVANGDMEIVDGINPQNWVRGTWGNHTAVFTYPVTGHNGEKAARVEITNYPANGTGDAKWTFNKVPVTPGVEYSYTDHYRSNVISDIIGQYTLSNGSFHYFGLHKEIPPSATWSTAGGTFTPPADATHVRFFHLISSVGFVEIDDAVLSEVGAGTPSETNAPVVEFTNLYNGQVVSGIVTLTASSSDDTAVTYIFYAVNGTPVSGQITTAPYSHNWDTTTYADGTYLLKATTHDPYGNNSTHTISVTVNNSTPTSPNLIKNPVGQFIGENGDPEHWFRGGWGTNDRTYQISQQAETHNMNTAIESYTDGDSKWYFEDVPVIPGESYTLSHIYKTFVAGGATQVMARFTMVGGGYQYMLLATPADSLGKWTMSTQTFVVPENVVSMTAFHALVSVNTLQVGEYDLRLTSQVGDSVSPSAVVTSPTTGSTVSGQITVTVNAVDNVGIEGVKLFVDGIVVGAEDMQSPHTFQWDTTMHANGAHTIYVVARDGAGNAATSSEISVTVDNSSASGVNMILNPSLETAGAGGNPANWFRGGWGTNDRTFTYPVVGIDGTDAAKVEITSYTNGDAKWYFQEVPVSAGVAYAYSEQYKSTVSTEVIVRYTLSGGGTQYQYLGALPASSTWTTANFTITPPANTASLTVFHILYAVGSLEVDAFSLTDPASIPDTTLPTAAITAPINGATVSNQLSIDATAADNVGVVGVMLFVDGVAVLTEDTTAPYSFTLDTHTLANGVHTLMTSARDAAGNVGTSTAVLITIDNAPVSSNLINNPSVEVVGVSGDPLHWTKGGWGNNSRSFTYPVAGFAGDNAIRVDVANYVDGDAKWRFDDVAVTPGQIYTMTHAYRSDVTTNITARYTLANGTFQYVWLGNKAPSPAWNTSNLTFVAPANAVSVTVMHILNANGYLELDDFIMSEGNTNQFAQGMVTFTFDDGWLSHYTHALPVLDAANIDGVFYVISQETMNQPAELVQNGDLTNVDGGGNPLHFLKGGWGANTRSHLLISDVAGSYARVEISAYTSGDAKWFYEDVSVFPDRDYELSHSYRSDIASEVVLRYTLEGGATQYAFVAGLPSTGGSWQTFATTVTTPANAVSLTVFHVIAGVGYLETDAYSAKLERSFINQSEMLAIQASGHEIGGHSQTHPSLSTITPAEAEIEISGSRTDIIAMGGLNVNGLAYPYGDYNPTVQALTAAAGYTSGRSVDRGYNTKATDKFALKIQQIGRTTTLADVQGWVQQAITDKTWLILMYHQVDYDMTADLGITPEQLAEHAAYINSTTIDVVTLAQGLAQMNP